MTKTIRQYSVGVCWMGPNGALLNSSYYMGRKSPVLKFSLKNVELKSDGSGYRALVGGLALLGLHGPPNEDGKESIPQAPLTTTSAFHPASCESCSLA